MCFSIAGTSFEELAHKTFKYYEIYVKKFILPSPSCGYGQKHLYCWMSCCGCPDGCEPKYNTTLLDKCLKNATLTRHRKFDKKTKLPLSEVKKSFLPKLTKIPRSEFELNSKNVDSAKLPQLEPKVPETPSSNSEVQANSEKVEVDEIFHLKTPAHEKTILENHKNHKHHHKIPRSQHILSENPSSNFKVQANQNNVKADETSPLKTMPQEKTILENHRNHNHYHKIPRSEHILSENPSSNFKVQANQDNVKENEISPLKTMPQEKTILENHRNHKHHHKIPRLEQIVPEAPSSNFEVQANSEKVEVDEISPLKTPAQEKESIENDKLIQDFVNFAKLSHLEPIVPDNTDTQKSSQDSLKPTSEIISDDSSKKLKSFAKFNEKKRRRNLAKLHHLAPKGPETASFNFEVQVNPEKVKVDEISPLKTPDQEKETLGNDKMNQEIFNSASVPFPEPKVPETASFNFELQGNPENVKVDEVSSLKTSAQEKEIVENDKLNPENVISVKLPHSEPAVPDTNNKQKSSQDSLKSTSEYMIDNSSKEAEKKRLRNLSFHKLDKLPHYPPAHQATNQFKPVQTSFVKFEKNGSAEIPHPKPAVGFPGFPGLLSSLLAQQQKR